MRQLKWSWLLLLCFAFSGVARAQNVRIIFPQEGQAVRGEISVRFDGVPSGGYAQVKMDGQFIQATAQDSFTLDTISDRSIFPRGDGSYRLTITAMNAGGKRAGEAEVNFRVANGEVDPSAEAVRLVHWSKADRLDPNVQRYRVFAESNATISGGDAGAAGGADGEESWLAAPLDWQVAALLRRVVRDTGMFSDDPNIRSANIRTIVQEAFERQRMSESGGSPETAAASVEPGAPKPKKKKKKAGVMTAPVKAPWNKDAFGQPLWDRASETGQYFVKMIQQSGLEINATRKAPTIAMADLLPTFPETPVRLGSTWQTRMTLLGELSARRPINVEAPITFTAFESLQTPGGESRRCAKLESRFRLPENLSKRIAIGLAAKAGSTGTSKTASPVATGAAIADDGLGGLTEDDIAVAHTDVARVLWFDIERRHIIRSEDVLRTNYELAVDEDAGGGAGAAQSVSYSLNVTTWMDDRVPTPTDKYNNGAGTAHARDSVPELSLAKVTTPR